MAIVYYPNRLYKGKVPAIDRVMAKRDPMSVTGAHNASSTAMDVIISNDSNWQVDSIGWSFSNASSREFSAFITGGRQVVEHYNDFLWFQLGTSIPKMITLTPGFYTGTQLAVELKTQLDTTFGIVFTVAYDSATGLFTITPSSGSIRYLDTTPQVVSLRQSIAGHLFGLNTTTVLASNVASDTAVFGLDSEVALVSQTSGDLSYYHNDVHTMTIDQAIHLTSNSGSNVMIGYTVDYESIV